MKKILATLISCVTDLIDCPEFRAYKLYISNSNKVKNQDVANGMAAAASAIETLEQRMGTLALAVTLADNIKPVSNDKLRGFVDGADLVMNKFDELLGNMWPHNDVAEALVHAFGYLPKEEIINKCSEVCAMAEEIESVLKK